MTFLPLFSVFQNKLSIFGNNLHVSFFLLLVNQLVSLVHPGKIPRIPCINQTLNMQILFEVIEASNIEWNSGVTKTAEECIKIPLYNRFSHVIHAPGDVRFWET